MKRIRCEVYSRVVGYLRPVDVVDPSTGLQIGGWNPGKKQEFAERVPFSVTQSLRSLPPAPAEIGEMGATLIAEGVIRS